jgi:DNA-binding transcriptional LysR family regulator
MQRERFNDLVAFLAVARERSFTRAAAQLGVSQSALSHAISGLEARLGLRLLTRTTRSVSPTEAGERLVLTVAPRFEEIEAEMEALTEFREKPAGTIRITASEHAVSAILWPKLAKFLRHYSDIKVEITVDHSLVDIVAQRYDAGVRSGEQIAKDDRSAHRAGHAHGGSRRPVVLREAIPAKEAARPDRSQVHQSAPGNLWRVVRLGV